MDDLIIVGAGFAGLTCAQSAARRGLRVRVLERKRAVGANVHTTGLLVKEAAQEWEVPGWLTRKIHGVRLYSPALEVGRSRIARLLFSRDRYRRIAALVRARSAALRRIDRTRIGILRCTAHRREPAPQPLRAEHILSGRRGRPAVGGGTRIRVCPPIAISCSASRSSCAMCAAWSRIVCIASSTPSSHPATSAGLCPEWAGSRRSGSRAAVRIVRTCARSSTS